MKELNYDVAIIGGGVAGVCAAIASAKCGAKTLIIEKNAVFGGMCTEGLVSVWCGRTNHGFFKQILADEARMKKRRRVNDPERLKIYFFDKIEEAGADVLLHSTFTGAEVECGKIKAVILDGRGEKIKVKASVFIDATGDGNVAAGLGASYQLGRETDNLCEPVSLIFKIGGVDDERAVYPTFGSNPELEEKMAEYVKNGLISSPAGHVIIVEGFTEGTAYVNMTNMCKINGSDVFELTKAELFTRKQIPGIVQFLKECVPGYENCYLLETAAYAGVRETRHIECDYCFSEEDIIAGTKFNDWIVSGAVKKFGAHSLTGSGFDEGNRELNKRYDGRPYTIPYRSITVKGFDNLLVAGRCICGTHAAHTSFRIMPICMALGDGAGVAAALAASSNGDMRNIDIDELHRLLKEVLDVEEA